MGQAAPSTAPIAEFLESGQIGGADGRRRLGRGRAEHGGVGVSDGAAPPIASELLFAKSTEHGVIHVVAEDVYGNPMRAALCGFRPRNDWWRWGRTHHDAAGLRAASDCAECRTRAAKRGLSW